MEENRYWRQISQKPHPIRKVSHTILHGLIWFVHFSPQLCFVLFGRFPLSSTWHFLAISQITLLLIIPKENNNNNNKINKHQLSSVITTLLFPNNIDILRHQVGFRSLLRWFCFTTRLRSCTEIMYTVYLLDPRPFDSFDPTVVKLFHPHSIISSNKILYEA